jgi:hypothetical protein
MPYHSKAFWDFGLLSYLSVLISLGFILTFPTTTSAAPNASLSVKFNETESAINYSYSGQLNDSLSYVVSPYFTFINGEENRLSISEAYLRWSKNDFNLDVGRKIITYGPGRYGFPMLGPIGGEAPYDQFGQSAEGYDQIGYSFKKNLWDRFELNYHKFYAWVGEADYRMLLGQRTTIDWKKFTLGFSETALVNKDAPPLYYLPIPFIPVYLYQNAGSYLDYESPNSAGNMAMGFDLTWRATENLKLYGEYYMDDRPWPTLKSGLAMPEWDRWWWKVGYQAGMEWKNAFHRENLTLYTEYTRISQYCYTSWHPNSGSADWTPGLDWTYKGYLIGDPLGPDADRFNLELVWEQSPEWQWDFAYILKRRGAGKIGDHWYYQPGKTEIFLTGTVEVTNIFDVTLTRKLNLWEYSLRLGVAGIEHQGNIRGETALEPRLAAWARRRF